ncbi:MUC3B protein, partial [Dasyornis broadbenti]|nr:MUC3B protein [Dasyornis broadbenti]
ADPCQNGGRWTGAACLCPPNVDGARCEFGATTINLTAELGPFVTMMARVTNREFSEDMTDPASPRRRRFAEEFGRTMDGIYRNVSDYRGIRVLSLSRGSVVVDFKLQLWPPQRRRSTTPVSGAGDTWGHHGGVGWGQGTSDRRLVSAELCRKHAPANFSRFYFPYRTANGLLCVTNCTLNVPGAFDCHRG